MSHLRTLALGAFVLAGVVGLATPASAEAQVTVTDTDGSTDAVFSPGEVVTVNGTGFQSIQGGAGGIYVMFGWVDDAAGGTWRPSNGGVTGHDYLYVPDDEGLDNAGFQRFVAFPGSGTADAANGGTVAEDGSWSVQFTIPPMQFEALDREGAPTPVDCAQVQCGIITFGAHGVKNPTNESFTPITVAPAAIETPPEDTATPAVAETSSTDPTTIPASADPTTSSAVEANPDSSAVLTLWLSIGAGLVVMAVIVILGVRRTRARGAADPTTGPADVGPRSTKLSDPGADGSQA